jgi:LysM repeat protein
MELPKNVTQIGEADPHCKIYVEDYAVSFLKQLNKDALNKDVSAAVYGYTQKEGDISYIFIYGAGRLDQLQREVRHLSQAQLQEMEKIRKKYFLSYELMGYLILNGEMIEGMYIYEQGICRYTAGYAQFYEKNDSMLAYMLDFKGGSREPEVVDWKKYDTVRKQQEERRVRGNLTINDRSVANEGAAQEGISDNERKELNDVWHDNARSTNKSIGRMKFTAAAVFALLCIIGVRNINNGEEVSGTSVIVATGEASETAESSTDAGKLVAQDKLADAVLDENNTAQYETAENMPSQDNQENAESAVTTDATVTDSAVTDVSVADNVLPSVQTEQQSYTIQKGDTLLEISIRQYGNAARIKEICSLNNIENPDDIKVGQKILLP